MVAPRRTMLLLAVVAFAVFPEIALKGEAKPSKAAKEGPTLLDKLKETSSAFKTMNRESLVAKILFLIGTDVEAAIKKDMVLKKLKREHKLAKFLVTSMMDVDNFSKKAKFKSSVNTDSLLRKILFLFAIDLETLIKKAMFLSKNGS
ncbi:uncharacterized protein LOC144145189 isoform X2 [Haemaphysalis longicornis]